MYGFPLFNHPVILLYFLCLFHRKQQLFYKSMKNDRQTAVHLSSTFHNYPNLRRKLFQHLCTALTKAILRMGIRNIPASWTNLAFTLLNFYLTHFILLQFIHGEADLGNDQPLVEMISAQLLNQCTVFIACLLYTSCFGLIVI